MPQARLMRFPVLVTRELICKRLPLRSILSERESRRHAKIKDYLGAQATQSGISQVLVELVKWCEVNDYDISLRSSS